MSSRYNDDYDDGEEVSSNGIPTFLWILIVVVILTIIAVTWYLKFYKPVTTTTIPTTTIPTTTVPTTTVPTTTVPITTIPTTTVPTTGPKNDPECDFITTDYSAVIGMSITNESHFSALDVIDVSNSTYNIIFNPIDGKRLIKCAKNTDGKYYKTQQYDRYIKSYGKTFSKDPLKLREPLNTVVNDFNSCRCYGPSILGLDHCIIENSTGTNIKKPLCPVLGTDTGYVRPPES